MPKADVCRPRPSSIATKGGNERQLGEEWKVVGQPHSFKPQRTGSERDGRGNGREIRSKHNQENSRETEVEEILKETERKDSSREPRERYSNDSLREDSPHSQQQSLEQSQCGRKATAGLESRRFIPEETTLYNPGTGTFQEELGQRILPRGRLLKRAVKRKELNSLEVLNSLLRDKDFLCPDNTPEPRGRSHWERVVKLLEEIKPTLSQAVSSPETAESDCECMQIDEADIESDFSECEMDCALSWRVK